MATSRHFFFIIFTIKNIINTLKYYYNAVKNIENAKQLEIDKKNKPLVSNIRQQIEENKRVKKKDKYNINKHILQVAGKKK